MTEQEPQVHDMSQDISGLPPYEEVHSHMHIQIINKSLHSASETKVVNTSLNRISGDGTRTPIDNTFLYTITDEVVGQYLPSKVWYSPVNGVSLLYYVSASLPDQVRPFRNGKCYALLIEMNDETDVIEYNAEIRLLIDQVQTPSGLIYVIMFSDDAYEDVIV